MTHRESDGGNKSRKLWFAAGTSVLIVVAGYVVPPAVVGEVIAGLVSCCAVYTGGNTATRWVQSRFQKTEDIPKEDTPKPKKHEKPEDQPPIEHG